MSDIPARPYPITVVGLGPGDLQHLTIAARDALAAAEVVWLRTARHPGSATLPTTAPVRSFDELYEAADSFAEVYDGIAAQLVRSAGSGPVVYAVPGDPATGESSVGRLRSAAVAAGVPLVVLPGVSFVGPVLAGLGWDAVDGLQLGDATSLMQRHVADLDPDRPALIAQVYSRLVASDLKIVLLATYPPDHEVSLVSGAGTPTCSVRTTTLAEMDHCNVFGDLTSLAVPPLPYAASLTSLADVVARLRAPDGCPWDREQTHESLRPYLLEEAYEVLAALDAGDEDELADELGDLLLQIVLHAQLASEDGVFSLSDVTRAITEKIVRRHPHVFGDDRADTPGAVRGLWEQLKAVERADSGAPDHPFDGVPDALPALARAQVIQRKASSAAQSGARGDSVPADPDALAAMAAAITCVPDDLSARTEVLGRALWGLVGTALEWGVDAETALREVTNERLAQLTATHQAGTGDCTDQAGTGDCTDQAGTRDGTDQAGTRDGTDQAGTRDGTPTNLTKGVG